MNNLKTTVLWIDDIRNPKLPKWQNWISSHLQVYLPMIVWVKSFNECCAWIDKYGLPDCVCFDHDLGDVNKEHEEKTGYDCAKYMVDYCMDHNKQFPQYDIQSDNGPGAENIRTYIENFKRHWNK